MSYRRSGLLLIAGSILAIGIPLLLRYAKEQLGSSWGGSRVSGDIFAGIAIVAFAILYYLWPLLALIGIVTLITGRKPWLLGKRFVEIFAVCDLAMGIGMIGVAYTSSNLLAGVIFGAITILGFAVMFGGIRSRVG
jgi:hypothetical protein